MEIVFENGEELSKVELVNDHFSIDGSCIDKELCQIGSLLVSYGEYEAILQLEVSRNEAHKERVYSQVDAELRKEGDIKGRLTEGKIKSMITLDPRFVEVVDKLANSRYNYAKIRWAMRALTEKSANLRAQAFRDSKMLSYT